MIVEKEFTIKKGGYRQSWGGDFWPASSFKGLQGGYPRKKFQFFFKNQKLTYRYKKSRSFKYLRTPVWLRQAFKNLLGQYDPPPLGAIGLNTTFIYFVKYYNSRDFQLYKRWLQDNKRTVFHVFPFYSPFTVLKK